MQHIKPPSIAPISAVVSASDRKTIARIVRVNHAGEFGAIRIYTAQIAVARRFYPDITAKLTEMLEHEMRHCALFQRAMPTRGARQCRTMGLWSWGGYLLGLTTALMGRNTIWVCTEAVEDTVHRHLDEQIWFLNERDHELAGIIEDIRDEEFANLRFAQDNLRDPRMVERFLSRIIRAATDTLIWLFTWGDSMRMTRDLARARRARA